MGMPQIIMIVLMAMSVGVALSNNGKPREGRYSFWATVIATGIQIWILKTGGFF